MYYCDIAQIHLSVFDNTVGAIFNLSQSLDLSIKTSQVDLEIRNRIFLTLSYTLLGNYIESVNYLKPILSDPRYKKINLTYLDYKKQCSIKKHKYNNDRYRLF